MRPDDILVLDMLLAARDARDFLTDRSFDDLAADRLRQLGVLKSTEIIGEAAAHNSETFQFPHSELPWREIIGMRNRLVHGCFEVNVARVRQRGPR